MIYLQRYHHKINKDTPGQVFDTKGEPPDIISSKITPHKKWKGGLRFFFALIC